MSSYKYEKKGAGLDSKWPEPNRMPTIIAPIARQQVASEKQPKGGLTRRDRLSSALSPAV